MLDFVTAFYRENGYEPSISEIRAAVGLRSKSTVHSHLLGLERSGHIECRKIRGRSAYRPVSRASV